MPAMLPLAERLRDRYWLATTLLMNVRSAQAKGDWQLARTHVDSGLVLSAEEPRLLAARTVLEFQLGNIDKANAHLEQFLQVWSVVTPGPTADYGIAVGVITSIARITGNLDRLDIAEIVAETIISSPSATATLKLVGSLGMGMLAVLKGDEKVAQKQYAELEPTREATVSGFMFPHIDRLLGLLAHTVGDLEKGVGHFEDSLTLCRQAGFRPEQAWTCCDYADTLLQRNGSGDREQAQSFLDESLAISTELGMRPLACCRTFTQKIIDVYGEAGSGWRANGAKSN